MSQHCSSCVCDSLEPTATPAPKPDGPSEGALRIARGAFLQFKDADAEDLRYLARAIDVHTMELRADYDLACAGLAKITAKRIEAEAALAKAREALREIEERAERRQYSVILQSIARICKEALNE